MSTTIVEYSKTEAALSELREKYSRKYDVATTAGMTEARQARAEIKKYRTNLEAMRKEIKAPALERCKLIDAEAARITAELEALESPIDETIKAEENRKEAERIAAEQAAVALQNQANLLAAQMRQRVTESVGRPSAFIADQIDGLIKSQLPDSVHKDELRTVATTVLGQLTSMRDATLRQEQESQRIAAERAELERLRALAAQEDEQRKARAEAEAKAERAKLDAIEREAQRARDEADAKARAERERQDREAAAARAKEDARMAAERAKLDAEKAAAEKKAKDEQARIDAAKAQEAEAKAAKVRKVEEDARKKMDGYQTLRDFVARFGGVADFEAICAEINDFLREAAPAKKAVAR